MWYLKCIVFGEMGYGLEHDDASKAFWRKFHSMLKVLHNRLHTNSLFYLALRFDIIGICVEGFDFALTCTFRFVISFSLLAEEGCEAGRVILCGCRYIWLSLSMQGRV